MNRALHRLLYLTILLLGTLQATAQDEPPPLNVFNGELPQVENVYFVAVDGDDDHVGDEANPFATLERAIGEVRRGDAIVIRGGVYMYDRTITIQTPSGFTDEMITLAAYPGEVPVFDFSLQPKERNLHGIRLNANFWHVIGITVRNASHNGIRIDGSFNILDQITAYGNHDSGIHMAGGASYNLIRNSDSFHNFNYDTNRTPRVGNNADGFSAKFESLGPGNRFVGCRAWENSDDGFDLWMAPNTIVIENSWAFGNGDAAALGYEGDDFEGNGNGFKLGGNFVHTPHIVRRSMAFDNFGSGGNAKGFDHNNNWGAMTLEHNTAYNNGRNFIFPGPTPEGQSVFINNLSVAPKNTHTQLFPGGVEAGNSWQNEEEVVETLFLSVDTETAKRPRQADGSLPDIDLLKLVPESFLVDGGVAFGQPFYGTAPDVGAQPFVSGALVDPWIEHGTSGPIDELRIFDLTSGAAWQPGEAFETGADAYADAETRIESVSSEMEVEFWIRTASGTRNKNYLFPVADFVMMRDATVLIAHADAIEDKPEWLDAYTRTSARVVLTSSGTLYPMTVYAREVKAGDTVAVGRNRKDSAEDAPMYLIMLGLADAVSAEPSQVITDGVRLHPNYPNPFSGSTTVAYELRRPGDVAVSVYDAVGRKVKRLAEGMQTAGRHEISWVPRTLPSGVYHLRIVTEEGAQSRSMVLAR